VNFPAEFVKLHKMVEKRDRRVWAVAKGETMPATIDDRDTGTLARVETNAKGPIRLTSPDDSKKTFKLAEGYEINLFASEVEFPDLKKPVQMAFDAKGRLWVTTMPSYPMYLPGRPVNDKILIFDDTNGDGKADKETVFADGLHVPVGIELGDGGVYVSQQPNLMFLKDTNGDDKADTRDIIMHGFDTADSHHAMHAFTWDPGGALYWQEGTFHYSQIETPYGPRRCNEAGIYRFEPRTLKFDVFVSYGFANPWGHYFDRWGQNLVADASGGANYYGTAFSGQVVYPQKHGSIKEFLVKQWRPTCGCELVASRNFPDDTQGDYLLNNDIGFQGILRYRMKDEGSGFHADPIEPLLQSSDPNFRPVALQFGPDGALYVVDWFNPLIGHMQHSLRDPNRDVEHGRIWRIHYTKRPLVAKPKIAGASTAELLDLLKVYEDRTRYRARRELHDRPTKEVMAALKTWVAGLSKTDAAYWHSMLEALWLHQSHNVVDEGFLKTMLTCPEPKARAAATRVLCYWRDQVASPLELLRKQVNDENARVRLEAIRALSFFEDKDAATASEIALESLAFPQDYYLEYTLNETNKTLDRRVGRETREEAETKLPGR
jgi:glucose/arabinose dehydrogenase